MLTIAHVMLRLAVMISSTGVTRPWVATVSSGSRSRPTTGTLTSCVRRKWWLCQNISAQKFRTLALVQLVFVVDSFVAVWSVGGLRMLVMPVVIFCCGHHRCGTCSRNMFVLFVLCCFVVGCVCTYRCGSQRGHRSNYCSAGRSSRQYSSTCFNMKSSVRTLQPNIV